MELKDKYKYARAFIVLLAALIALLLNMKYQRELNKSLVIVLVVIIVFYAISTVAIRLIDKIKNMEKTEVVSSDEEDEEEATETEN